MEGGAAGAAARPLSHSGLVEGGADARPLGISLEGLRALVAKHGGRSAFAGKSTAWVKYEVVLPATRAAGSSYVAPLAAAGSPHVAPATAFISHAYDDEFLGMLDAITALEAKERTRFAFYYIDLLVVNQHGQGDVVPYEVLRDEFGHSVKAIGNTLLVLRWANPIALQRAWCVFELAITKAADIGVKVLMPPEDAAAFREALLNDFDSLTNKTCHVDVEKAKASKKTDLDNIQLVIRGTGGYLRTNQLVIGAMKSWMEEEGRAALAAAEGEIEKAAYMTNLAILLHGQGKLDGAEPLFLGALAVRRRVLGNEHSSTLNSINNLANLLSDQGKLGEAEPLYLEALAACRRTLGNEHPVTLASIVNLACLLGTQGKLVEAERLFREALAAYRRTLGNVHPETLTSIKNLAIHLHDQGKLDEAEPLYLEASAARRRKLGNEHPDTLFANIGLALLYSDRRAYSSAESLLTECLPTCRRVLGATHPFTFWYVAGLATCLRRQGRLDEALPLAMEAHAGRCALLGERHLETLSSAHELGVLLRLLGSARRAAPHARAAHAGHLALQGAASRLTLASQLSLARLEGNVALAASIAEAGIQE